MTIDDAVHLILGNGGTLVVFILIIAAGARRYWVWGYQLADAERRAEAWEQRFLTAMELSARSIDVVSRAVATPPPGIQRP